MGGTAGQLMAVVGGLRRWTVERRAAGGVSLLSDLVVVTERRMWFGAVSWSQTAGLSSVRYDALCALSMSSCLTGFGSNAEFGCLPMGAGDICDVGTVFLRSSFQCNDKAPTSSPT